MIRIVLRVVISPQALRIMIGAFSSVVALLGAKKYRKSRKEKTEGEEGWIKDKKYPK